MIWLAGCGTHQALHGDGPGGAPRRYLHQLGGITASMALRAGIRWNYSLYGLAAVLVGLFFGGGSDGAEEELQRGAVNLLSVAAKGPALV